MNYEEFKQELLERLEQEKPEFVKEFRATTTKKDNNNQYDSIVIDYEHSSMSPILYPEQFYQSYQSGKHMEDIVDDIVMIAARESQKRNFFNEDDINPENAKDCLTLRLVNKEWNSEMAENCAYLGMNDLMAVPRWKLSVDGSEGSFLVTRDIQRNNLHMTDEEILAIARKNAVEQGFTVKGMSEVLMGMLDDDFDVVIGDIRPNEKENMYVMTNKEGCFGAVGLISDELMKDIREKIGENFYIIPSSVHEVLVIPESTCDDPKVLQDMCKEVNENMVDVKERLSNNIYRYNGEQLHICNSRKEMIEQVTEALKQKHIPTVKRRIN